MKVIFKYLEHISYRHFAFAFGFLWCLTFSIGASDVRADNSPATPKLYTSERYGIAFSVPNGVSLYTRENPGKLSSLFSSGDIVRLVNPRLSDENISISQSGSNKVTQRDIRTHKKNLTANPSKPLPGYRNVSVKFIKIGREKSKTAVEHIYRMKGNVPGTIRQVVFSHKERGFIVTCGTSTERFNESNKAIFDLIFNTLEFIN